MCACACGGVGGSVCVVGAYARAYMRVFGRCARVCVCENLGKYMMCVCACVWL